VSSVIVKNGDAGPGRTAAVFLYVVSGREARETHKAHYVKEFQVSTK
jgi:hypothetical protein